MEKQWQALAFLFICLPSRLLENELDDQFQERVHVMIDAIGREVIKVIYLSPNDPSLLEEKKMSHYILLWFNLISRDLYAFTVLLGLGG